MESIDVRIEDFTSRAAAALGVGVVTVLYLVRLYIRAYKSPLHAIPTVGYSGVLTSYITAVKYLFYAQDLVQEGYVKYHGEPFKVATMGRWLVLVSGTQIMEDVRKAKEDQLSNVEGLTEVQHSLLLFLFEANCHRLYK
ncbi:hypothetical protein BDQ17DRAFT_909166 [Cyathus striatus]|nr:hypothetical protein BDQ17DRAFT_909166 [Cyathus striatus]